MSGVEALGYMVFDLAPEQMAPMQVLLGQIMELDTPSDGAGGFHARIDGRPFRLHFRKASEYRISAIGWEVSDGDGLSIMKSRVENSGIICTELSPAECLARAVSAGFRFVDADGFHVEIVVDRPFASEPELEAKFVGGKDGAGSFGFGHIVQSSANPAAAIAFYSDVMGLAITDRIVWPDADLMFLHCNNRHHSLAIAGEVLGLEAGRIDHFMIEATSREQIDAAYAQLEANGFQVSMTLGQHSNDHMYSFYVYAPAPFRIEFGFGGRDAKLTEYEVYDSPSNWGHEFHPPSLPA